MLKLKLSPCRAEVASVKVKLKIEVGESRGERTGAGLKLVGTSTSSKVVGQAASTMNGFAKVNVQGLAYNTPLPETSENMSKSCSKMSVVMTVHAEFEVSDLHVVKSFTSKQSIMFSVTDTETVELNKDKVVESV